MPPVTIPAWWPPGRRRFSTPAGRTVRWCSWARCIPHRRMRRWTNSMRASRLESRSGISTRTCVFQSEVRISAGTRHATGSRYLVPREGSPRRRRATRSEDNSGRRSSTGWCTSILLPTVKRPGGTNGLGSAHPFQVKSFALYGPGGDAYKETAGLTFAAPLPPGIETNLRVQPIQPIEHGLLIESVSRVIPVNRLRLRRGCLQRLRIGRRYQSVQSSVLQQQHDGRRVPNESNRLYRRHGPEPVYACCTGQSGHEVRVFRTRHV